MILFPFYIGVVEKKFFNVVFMQKRTLPNLQRSWKGGSNCKISMRKGLLGVFCLIKIRVVLPHEAKIEEERANYQLPPAPPPEKPPPPNPPEKPPPKLLPEDPKPPKPPEYPPLLPIRERMIKSVKSPPKELPPW